MPINESKLIERSITLRNMRLTKEVTETRRSLVRWLALALGVINPGESRYGVIAVLDAMLYFQFSKQEDPNVGDMLEYIGGAWEPMNEKTLRYHLLQLKKSNILNNSKGKYYFSQPMVGDKYDERAWLESYFTREVDPIKEKIAVAMRELKGR